jgi:hypothetical protein
LELVDTPGLSRTHEGNAARLGQIREAGCLVIVAAGFAGADPLADAGSMTEDFLLTDMEIVTGRIARLRESVKKPRPSRDQELAELATLEIVLAALERGQSLAESGLSDEQLKATRSFCLLSQKPALVLVNLADDEPRPERFGRQTPLGMPLMAAAASLRVELSRMDEADRAEFEREMSVPGPGRDDVLRKILDVSGQILYFTAGEKEVRTWLLPRGGTALAAADNVHSDLARGFIRAETVSAADLIRLGSEREVKAQNLMRQEPKDYVVQDGDVLHIRFSV